MMRLSLTNVSDRPSVCMSSCLPPTSKETKKGIVIDANPRYNATY